MKSNKNNRPEVFLIDDNPAVLFLHELMLEESGISEETQKFENAEEALFEIQNQNHRPQNNSLLLFLDINMPKMDGWRFMDALDKTECQYEIFIVMVTSSINKADKETAKMYRNVIHFVEKPLNLKLCQDLKSHPKLKHFFQEE